MSVRVSVRLLVMTRMRVKVRMTTAQKLICRKLVLKCRGTSSVGLGEGLMEVPRRSPGGGQGAKPP